MSVVRYIRYITHYSDGRKSVKVMLVFEGTLATNHYVGAKDYKEWLAKFLRSINRPISSLQKETRSLTLTSKIMTLRYRFKDNWSLDTILVPIPNSQYSNIRSCWFVTLEHVRSTLGTLNYQNIINFIGEDSIARSFPYSEHNLMVAILGGDPNEEKE